jgi:AcrR family transcriptional regulator
VATFGAMPRGLTRGQVLDATFALAHEEGLQAVSMRGVARRLGVTPMALYRHVGDKQGLLDGLVERLLDELPIPDPALDWRARMLQLMTALRTTARSYPEAFLLLLRRPAATPAALRRRDSVYAALRDAGIPEALVPRVERLLNSFVIGFAASEGAGRFAEVTTQELDEDLAWAFEHVLEPLAAELREDAP